MRRILTIASATVALVLAGAAAAVVLAQDLRGLLGVGRQLELDVVTALWGFASATSFVVYATAQLLPRL